MFRVSTGDSIFRYSVFGSIVGSELELAGLQPGTGECQVFFRFGPVPEDLPGAIVVSLVAQVASGVCLLKIPRVARFLIRCGCEVVIESCLGSSADDLRVFLLGPVFGILLHQLSFLPLHGSAIEFGGVGVLFLGSTGVGKSTLAAAFLLRGYRVLADEICAVDTRQQPTLMTGPPVLALWEDALNELRIGLRGLQPVRPRLRKFLRPCGHLAGAARVPIGRCYILGSGGSSEGLTFEPLSGLGKVRALAAQTYRPDFLKALGRLEINFEQVCRVSGSMQITLVNRPAGGFTSLQLADAIERDFSG
jgi:HPr Serine kinase C-terminal domain